MPLERSTARSGAFLSVALFVGCVEGQPLSLPPAPDGTETTLIVEFCGNSVRAQVLDPHATQLVFTSSCDQPSEFVVVHYPDPAADFGWTPGPLELGSCRDGPQCCYEATVPFPELPGTLHRAPPPTDGSSADWELLSAWPADRSTLVYPRRCYCPRFGRTQVIEVSGYSNFETARIDDERMLIVGITATSRSQATRTDIYDIALTDLLGHGLTEGPQQRIERFRAASLSLGADGTFAIGNDLAAQVLIGRLGADAMPVSLSDSALRPTHVSIQPGSGEASEVAALSERHPTQFFRYSSNSWSDFDGRAQMEGVCTPQFKERQRPHVQWIGEHELLVMPAAFGCAETDLVCTATTAPDGFWHVVDGTPTWTRVERQDAECLSLLAYTPDLGILAMTRRPSILHRKRGQWRELVPAASIGPQRRDLEIRAVLPIPGGFAYMRQGGRVGAVVEEHLCEELPFGSMPRLRGLQRVGDWLVITSESLDVDEDGALIRALEVDWSENRALEP